MTKHRDSASAIWRTVVFAGAMLGAPLVAQADTKPTPPADQKPADKPADKSADKSKSTDKPKTDDKTTAKKKPAAKKRPRGTDDSGGGTGRGFILS